jgi:hypothetical protein
LEVPPPGVGLNTVTVAVPAVTISAAVIAAVNWVDDTYVVVRLAPFHCTTEPLTKLLPLTVSVKAAPPANADEGLKLVITGTGLVVVPVVADLYATIMPIRSEDDADQVMFLAVDAPGVDRISYPALCPSTGSYNSDVPPGQVQDGVPVDSPT